MIADHGFLPVKLNHSLNIGMTAFDQFFFKLFFGQA
jgi:hypothetical protein